MISIVKDEKDIKTYIQGTKKLFELYKLAKRYKMDDKITNKTFKSIVDKAYSDIDYSIDSIKGKILKENLLGDKTLTQIADETSYSVAHIYGIKQKILKEFSAMTFEVILL